MAFREKGHIAFSCDIEECSGGHLEWHIKEDVLPLLNGNCTFKTADGNEHTQVGKWDMIIAFPPCTHLAVSGGAWFEEKRKDGRQKQGIEFFCKFLKADCERIAVENPVGIMSGNYIVKWYPELCKKYGLPVKPTQIIHPYYFGDRVSKKTCLWLKGLNALIPTKMVEPDIKRSKNGKHSYSGPGYQAIDENGKKLAWNNPMTGKIRSKTYPGVAKAMAEQWG